VISRLLRPPRLRATLEEGEASDLRHATWMELFYDLVFVVAISALGGRLSDDYSPAGILQFVGLFIPVWWAWSGRRVQRHPQTAALRPVVRAARSGR
jgi:low temperature requirement protein LtrA